VALPQGIAAATVAYEAWLGSHLRLVPDDLAEKHRRMAKGPFQFLRATYYRWVERWEKVEPDLRDAPEVLSIGDLHFENFGTWRDADGRLAWGVNDFDEAFPLPWTQDLVRLATSLTLAVMQRELAVRPEEACAELLSGYAAALEQGGKPIVLAEDHPWLERIAIARRRRAARFWRRLRGPEVAVPESAERALRQFLPDPLLEVKVIHRVAGLGSLGRERFVALGRWRGGAVAREAKALAPSACSWLKAPAAPAELYYARLLRTATRASDPYFGVEDGWVVRRLAPDCAKIALRDLPLRYLGRLLFYQGYETGNVHLGTQGAADDVLKDLRSRKGDWLARAALRMCKEVQNDWKDWRAARRRPSLP